MGRLKPKPYKGEIREDYKQRLLNVRNDNPLVRIGFIKKR